MKTPKPGVGSALVAMVLLLGGAGSASAQIVRLCGSVTELTGIYVEDYPIGCSAVVQIDLTPPLVDELPDIPEWGMYRGRPIHLQVDGRSCPVDVWPHTVNIINKVGGWMSGLEVAAAWTGVEPVFVVSLGLVGETDLITDDSFFPAGIPLESFFSREGRYRGPEGTIGWTIDVYDVLPAPAAVPEPATFGLAGALGLAALALGRRYAGRRRSGGRRSGRAGARDGTGMPLR